RIRKRKHMVRTSALGRGAIVGCCERHPPGHDRDDRTGLHIETVGTQGNVDATGIPEPGVLCNELVVGRVDKNLDCTSFTALVQVVAHHLADFDTPIVNRRANFKRTEIRGKQGKTGPGTPAGNLGRLLQSDEFVDGSIIFISLVTAGTRIHANISARKQGTQARDTAGSRPWPSDPEMGTLLRDVRSPVTVQLGIDQHFGTVRRYFDTGNLTDDYVFIANLRLTYLQTIGGFKADCDGGPGMHPVAHQQR